MTKEVLIHLKGMQTTDAPHGSDDPLELITVFSAKKTYSDCESTKYGIIRNQWGQNTF